MKLQLPANSLSKFSFSLLYASCKKRMYVLKSTGPYLWMAYFTSRWSPVSYRMGE